MTDAEILKRSIELCERGPRLPLHEQIERGRLKRIVADEDVLEARYMVPILVDLIERRGLGDAKLTEAVVEYRTAIERLRQLRATDYREMSALDRAHDDVEDATERLHAAALSTAST